MFSYAPKISGHYLVPRLSGSGNRFCPERSEGATTGLRDSRYGLKYLITRVLT